MRLGKNLASLLSHLIVNERENEHAEAAAGDASGVRSKDDQCAPALGHGEHQLDAEQDKNERLGGGGNEAEEVVNADAAGAVNVFIGVMLEDHATGHDADGGGVREEKKIGECGLVVEDDV